MAREGPSEIEGGSHYGGWFHELLDRIDGWIDKQLGTFRPGRPADSDERLEPVDTRNAGGGDGSKLTEENRAGGER